MNKIEKLAFSNRDLGLAVASFGLTFIRLGIGLYTGLMILWNKAFSPGLISLAIFLIMILDYYDGVVFKKSLLNCEKLWRVRRRLLDSVADRLVIQIVCLPILFVNPSFFWVYVAICIRETLPAAYGVKLLASKVLVYPGLMAKLACVAVGLTTITFVLSLERLEYLCVSAMIGLTVLAMREYNQTVAEFNCSLLDGSRIQDKVETL